MVACNSRHPFARSRIMILDDHEAIIEMMRPIIESIPGYTVVGHATEAVHALEICRREHPDVLVLDLVLGGGSGLALLDDAKRACPLLRVLVFSGNIWPAVLRGALAAGVHGIVDKMSSLTEFRTALQAVRERRVYFSPFVSEQIKELVSRGPAAGRSPVPLTARERTILRYLAEGFSAKEVAEILGISSYTVVNHRSNLMRKIGLRGEAQISLYAAHLGLVGETVPSFSSTSS